MIKMRLLYGFTIVLLLLVLNWSSGLEILIKSSEFNRFTDVNNHKSVIFQFKCSRVAIVGFFNTERILYTVGIRPSSYRVKYRQDNCVDNKKFCGDLKSFNTSITDDYYTTFWYRWDVGQLEFGRGSELGSNRIGLLEDNRNSSIKYIGLSSRNKRLHVLLPDRADFGRRPGYRINSPVTVLYTTRSILDCGVKCLNIPTCSAFNYQPYNGYNCEIMILKSKFSNGDQLTSFNFTSDPIWTCYMMMLSY